MESKTRLARTPSIGPPLLQEAWRFSKPHRPTPSTRSARSSGDHDVGCRRGAVRLTLACLGVVPPALLLAAEDLEDEAADEEARETPLALARHGSEERGCRGGEAVRLDACTTGAQRDRGREVETKPLSQNGLSQ